MANDTPSNRNRAAAAPPPPPGHYAIDVRVFLAIIALVMTASFIAGVTMVPPDASGLLMRTTSSASTGQAQEAVLNVSEKDAKEIDQHHPSGQHLLVDIKGVDAEFLNSEERLAKAMVDTVKEAGYVKRTFIPRCAHE
jgi:hypothetical protein